MPLRRFRKTSENETEQDTPTSGLKFNEGRHKYNKETLEIVIDARKQVELEANTEKAKCTLMSPHGNAGKHHYMKTLNRTFGNVVKLKYSATTVTSQICIYYKLKRNGGEQECTYDIGGKARRKETTRRTKI
jgi:hypothetical protein